jgi:hypothetical protein
MNTAMDASAQARQDSAPVLTVVRGTASAQELAALVTVLAARRAAAARGAASPADWSGGPWTRGLWSSRAAMLRTPLDHGRDAWRTSGRPL